MTGSRQPIQMLQNFSGVTEVLFFLLATGVNPQRLLEGFNWPEFKWRRGELVGAWGTFAVVCLLD